MKRIFTTLLIAASLVATHAQNLQLHFDPRGSIEGGDMGSNMITGTFEYLKNSRLGSTFLFVDLDLHFNDNNLGMAYLEISHSFKLGKCPIQPHIEYNGGVMKGVALPHAYLAGAAYDGVWHKFYLKTYLVYKLNQFHAVSHDVQWTVVWDGMLGNDRWQIDGFMDLWTQNTDPMKQGGGKEVVLLAEPQFWYYPVKHRFAVGTEVELSANFYGKGFKCYPTAAVKYNF